MDTLCKLTQKVSQLITERLSGVLSDGGLNEFCLTGYCFKQDRFRTFRFDCSTTPSLTVTFHEVLKADGDIEYLGSADDDARQLFQNFRDTPPLSVLREVIVDPAIDDVGGAIQYGKTEVRDLKVFGVRDFHTDENAKEVTTEFSFAGMNFTDDPFQVKWDEFFLEQSFIVPFQQEIDKLADSGYAMVGPGRPTK